MRQVQRTVCPFPAVLLQAVEINLGRNPSTTIYLWLRLRIWFAIDLLLVIFSIARRCFLRFQSFGFSALCAGRFPALRPLVCLLVNLGQFLAMPATIQALEKLVQNGLDYALERRQIAAHVAHDPARIGRDRTPRRAPAEAQEAHVGTVLFKGQVGGVALVLRDPQGQDGKIAHDAPRRLRSARASARTSAVLLSCVSMLASSVAAT